MKKTKIIIKSIFLIAAGIVIVHLFAYAYVWHLTKAIIKASYDNYGVVTEKYENKISEDDFQRLAVRTDLSNDSRIDHRTDETVYGKDYEESYSYKFHSVYGTITYIMVNYRDSYLPENADGDKYPTAYGDRPCTVTWKLTVRGWVVSDFIDVL